MLLLSLALAAGAAWPFGATAGDRRDYYYFEVDLTSTNSGQTQIFFDMGRGHNEADSSRQPLRAAGDPVTYRYLMASGTLRDLRFDPIDRPGEMTIKNARILESTGREILRFSPGDFRPLRDIQTLEDSDGILTLRTTEDAGDPIISLGLPGPIELPFEFRHQFEAMQVPFVLILTASLLLMLALSADWARQAGVRARALATRRPYATLAALSLVAVAIQCRPVVFQGMSFVSPDNAGYLLYDRFPTLPGYDTKELEDARNADVGAMLYQHLYYPRIAQESLTSGDLPLWNRYDLSGVPLLGQGQSMFGELLNFLPMATGSSAGAWDFKFIVARWLYFFGMGTATFLLLRSVGIAALISVTAGFIGFFAYRINHPAQFSLCFSPWIIVGWLLIRDATSWRRIALGLATWFLANWEVMTSGTVKEAYMLILVTNLVGLFLLCFAKQAGRQRLIRLAAVTAGGLAFTMATAPFWFLFLQTLGVSNTSYDAPGVVQIRPGFFIGLFEDLFPRQLNPNEIYGDPSASLLVLSGLLWLPVASRSVSLGRNSIALALGSLVPLALAFGAVPAGLIMKIPLVANVHHIGNTFSCTAIIPLTLLSAIGLHAMPGGLSSPGALARLTVPTALLGLILGAYFWSSGNIALSEFFGAHLLSLGTAFAVGIAALCWGIRRGARGMCIGTLAVVLCCVLWRHAQYVETRFDAYVFNPKVRADLHAASPAVDFISARFEEPSRPAGIGYNLFSGYNQMLGWEGIYGVDALRSGYYDELAIASGAKKVRWWDSGQWSEADIAPLRPYQDLLNVRYYLATHSPVPREIEGLNYLASFDLDVYESETAWPRAFFTNRIRTYQTIEELAAQIRQGDGQPFAAVFLGDTEANEARGSMPQSATGQAVNPARDYSLESNTTTFTVDATGPGFIVLTETWYPFDFRVTINGSPKDYFRVNHAFKAIAVPGPGTYEVRFEYRPRNLTLMISLACAGLLGACVLIAWCGFADRRYPFAAARQG
jgi:hypothetical protein